MRICRFENDRVGIVRGDRVHDVTGALGTLGAFTYPLPKVDLLVANLDALRPSLEAAADAAPGLPLSDVKLLSPVANPGKIVAAPVNYQAHLDEAVAEPATFAAAHVRRIQETGLFLKATSSLVGPSEGVALRFPDRRNDHEIELAVIIGRAASNVSASEALDFVAGYAIGFDMTVRGPEERSLRKSIDSYTVLGPWMVTADEFGQPGDAGMLLTVNGDARQSAHTRDLILGVPELIAFASRFYTLLPGDVLLTGTPEGVGPVAPGDLLVGRIDRIGTMSVEIRAM